MDISIKTEGLKELEQVFRKFPSSVSRSLVLIGLRKSVRPIVKRARENLPAPIRKHASHVRAYSGRALGKAKGLIPSGLPTVMVGPSDEKWFMGLFEIGFRSRPSEPWLRPAVMEGRREFTKDLGRNIWKAIHRKMKTIIKQAYAGKVSRKSARMLGLSR